MAVVGSHEVSLSELLGRDEEWDHLICGCRPTIMLCGMFDPGNTAVLYEKVSGLPDCEQCTQVWHSTGCGACSCSARQSCQPCRDRYFSSFTN